MVPTVRTVATGTGARLLSRYEYAEVRRAIKDQSTRSGHVFQIFGRRCPDWVWVLQMALSFLALLDPLIPSHGIQPVSGKRVIPTTLS